MNSILSVSLLSTMNAVNICVLMITPQKKVADKKKHAAQMREFRIKKKLKCGQTTPNGTSTPKDILPLRHLSPATPATSTATPATSTVTPATSSDVPVTPKRQERLRQHCYNTMSKV